MRLADLRTGRTLVIGFGREGRALERAVLQRVPDADVHVLCDSEPTVAPRRWPMVSAAGAAGGLAPDRVLRSPGVPLDHPAVVAARAAQRPVTCITSLWFGERPDARVIAVTGSKGKSTTAALIAHLLDGAGRRAALGGNIGVPMLDLLETDAEWYVVELSSYQLADLRGHATAGAFTRLFPEHQDWHGGVEAYYAAKLRLIGLLEGRPLWFNGADPILADRLRGVAGGRPVNVSGEPRVVDGALWRGDRRLLTPADWSLPGVHNLDNAALALAVAESAAGPIADARRLLASFQPLPHRMQPVAGAPPGGRWLNDSISTSPHATLAALRACPGAPVLIVGGLERGSDWREVADQVRATGLSGLVGLPDNGAAIARVLVDAGAVPPGRVRLVDTIEEAVAAAAELRARGETVLLSPGAPSFPRFRDFEERGARFRAAVQALGGAAGPGGLENL